MTQFAWLPLNKVLHKRFKAPNPATNVPQCDEPMATDTIQSDTPAIDGGEKYAQFFVGVCSLLSDVHGMKSPASFPGVLMDQIIDRGAPMKLIKQAKLHSYRNAPKYKFGYQIPRDYQEAMKFDELNRNDRWDRSSRPRCNS
jgi:hypothetical protein